MKNLKLLLALGIFMSLATPAHAEVLVHELKWSTTNNLARTTVNSDNFYFNKSERPNLNYSQCLGFANVGCIPISIVTKIELDEDHHLVESSELEEVRALITAQDFSPAQKDLVRQLIKAEVQEAVAEAIKQISKK